MDVVGFSPRDARRLLETINREQVTPYPERFPATPFHLREIDVGTVSVELAARVGDTAGSGTVNSVYRFDPAVPDQPIQYTTYNYFSAAVEVDTYVVVARVMTGDWVVVAADCA